MIAYLTEDTVPCKCGTYPVWYPELDHTYWIFCPNKDCAFFMAEFDDFQDLQSAIGFWNDSFGKDVK